MLGSLIDNNWSMQCKPVFIPDLRRQMANLHLGSFDGTCFLRPDFKVRKEDFLCLIT